MQSVKDDIRKERNWIQTADVALFFEVAKFFTAYQRCSFSTKKVGEDLSIRCKFLDVQNLLL